MTSRIGRNFHKCGMGFWATQFVVVWFLPVAWRIPYLIICSIYANFVGHWSGWSAERPTEVEDSTEGAP